MTKTNGRQLSDETLKIQAEQVLELLKMWGMGQNDSYYMCRHMKYLCASHKGAWVNPLAGTGFTAAQLVDAIGVKHGLEKTVPDVALPAPLAKIILDS